MKSSVESVRTAERLYEEAVWKIPGLTLYVKAKTTSSIYCKTPDGFSLRIAGHKGREKYSYKYNLGPHVGKGRWVKEANPVDGKLHWRYYTSSVDELAEIILRNVQCARTNS